MSSFVPGLFGPFAGDSPAATENYPFHDGYVAPESYSNFDSTASDFLPPIYVSGGELPAGLAYFSSETNDTGPILPPPAGMEPEEGYALREWRR